MCPVDEQENSMLTFFAYAAIGMIYIMLAASHFYGW